MIKVDSKNGEFQARGPFDLILCEWTLLTRIIFKEMKEQFPEETANKLFAGLGMIAAKDTNEIRNVTSMFDEIMKAFDEAEEESNNES